MVEPRERVSQKSVTFKRRQIDFLDYCEENDIKINLNEICRKEIDKQMKILDIKQFLCMEDLEY